MFVGGWINGCLWVGGLMDVWVDCIMYVCAWID